MGSGEKMEAGPTLGDDWKFLGCLCCGVGARQACRPWCRQEVCGCPTHIARATPTTENPA